MLHTHTGPVHPSGTTLGTSLACCHPRTGAQPCTDTVPSSQAPLPSTLPFPRGLSATWGYFNVPLERTGWNELGRVISKRWLVLASLLRLCQCPCCGRGAMWGTWGAALMSTPHQTPTPACLGAVLAAEDSPGDNGDCSPNTSCPKALSLA